MYVLRGVRRRDMWMLGFTSLSNRSVELLTAPHQEAIWPSKLSSLCVCVRVCVCGVFACQDANKGMTDGPCESWSGTFPPLLFVPSGSSFVQLQRFSLGQNSVRLPPTSLSAPSFSAANVIYSSIDFLHSLLALRLTYVELELIPACTVSQAKRHKEVAALWGGRLFSQLKAQLLSLEWKQNTAETE